MIVTTEYTLNYTGAEINHKLEIIDETKYALENNYYTSFEIDEKYDNNLILSTCAPFIHMSFDDVTSVINDLSKGTLSSAFDNSFLALLKQAHEQYGFVFSLYLQTSPTSIPSKYQSELSAAASWLKWGLHSFNGSNYQSSSYDSGKADWNKMVSTVLQLTGTHKAIDRMPRLHQFYGSENALRGMRDASLGALGFLSTDDTRNAYYLPSTQLEYLYNGERDHITDFKNGLVFYRTDLRLDWFKNAGFTYNAAAGMSNHAPLDDSDIRGELERRYTDAQFVNTWNCFVIFTHEWQPISAISNALTEIGEFAKEYGVAFGFPQDNAASLTPYDIFPSGSGSGGAGTGGDSGNLGGGGDDSGNTGGDDSGGTPAGTIKYGSYTYEVVSELSDLQYTAGYSTASDHNHKPTTGRAFSMNYALAVDSGTTFTLVERISGLTYALLEMTDENGTVNTKGQTFSAWLSGSTTLHNDTKYVVIGFKNGAGTTDFTSEEIALLPSCLVTEQVSTTKITLDKTSLNFTNFTEQTIVATVEPSNSTQLITWESSNNSIAQVSNGVVTPKFQGSCVITARSGSCNANCAVTVNINAQPMESSTWISESLAAGTGQPLGTPQPSRLSSDYIYFSAGQEIFIEDGYTFSPHIFNTDKVFTRRVDYISTFDVENDCYIRFVVKADDSSDISALKDTMSSKFTVFTPT